MSMVDKLREHIKNTPREELIKEWNEIDRMNLPGPTAEEYIKFMDEYYGTDERHIGNT